MKLNRCGVGLRLSPGLGDVISLKDWNAAFCHLRVDGGEDFS